MTDGLVLIGFTVPQLRLLLDALKRKGEPGPLTAELMQLIDKRITEAKQ